MPTENRSRNEQKMVSAPKFYPIDAINAYPEPVGTNDRLEHHDGAVWVHLNGKRSKLVGMQSLVFLIGNLQAIHADVFGPEAAQPQGEPVARVEIGADRNAALTVTDENWLRSLKERGTHQVVPLYAEQPAPVAVVLPERKSVNTHNSHDWDEGYTDGWVAYDTALKRLNPSL